MCDGDRVLHAMHTHTDPIEATSARRPASDGMGKLCHKFAWDYRKR